MATDQRTSAISGPLLERIFANLIKKSQRHTSSRPSRRKADAFRSLLRHTPEVTYDSTWEAIRPLVANEEEFKAVESEEERVVVFDKVIRRLKEKREEEKRYREREGSARAGKREREESSHRERDPDSSRGRRKFEDDYDRSPGRSKARSRERTEGSRDRNHDRDKKYRDRSRSYSRMDEIEGPRKDQERSAKRRSDEDLRRDKKVHLLSR